MKDLKGKFISFKYRDRKEIISGFLIDYNDEWTLIKYNPVDYVIDGFMILKTKKILKYKRDDFEIFREKILLFKKLQPKEKDNLPLSEINETLKLVSKKFGAFQIINKDESTCYIGKLLKATNKYIVIKEIDAKAQWIETEKYELNKIRSIEFDTDYINSLISYSKQIENK